MAFGTMDRMDDPTVGAVYDRASFPGISEMRAVIDRAYN
jgi:hypothetical protein